MSLHPTTDRVAQDPSGPRRGPTVPRQRWPRPTPLNVVLVVVWVVGVLVATVVPLSLVSPTDTDPDPARVWLAFGITALGIAIFAAAGYAVYRRTRNGALLAWALIPGVSIGSSAVIFTATLLSI